MNRLAFVGACALLASPLAAERELPVVEDETIAIMLIEGMPEPAFQAALVDLIEQDGCVLDFTNYDQEQQRLILGMVSQLGIAPNPSETLMAVVDARLGHSLEEMQGQFEIDQDTRTVTLTGDCGE